MTTFLSAQQLRSIFLDYFKKQQHTIIGTSSLVPKNDSTLLFTNAGMVQFKDIFLGKEKSVYSRAASVQRCVRAGGKHNDLENVGYTARHHTFFEMLGNFSFGDYFKQEAIRFAWEFLTGTLAIPAEKLWITIFREDTESADYWLKDIGISSERLIRCGEDSNFWSMGPTGPCGACSEIFYDHGEKVSGGLPGSPNEHGDRYVEIWNLVFMQYDRAEDGTLTSLPQCAVDTGMGLERIAAVMQGVTNNYHIDLFQYLIKAIEDIALSLKVNINADRNATTSISSLQVIADHIRSAAFLITDGVFPSNEGRGYVLRRIIRRALRHGHQIGFSTPFFYRLVEPLIHVMGQAYPELIQSKASIEKILQQEEEQFSQTLSQGLTLFEQTVNQLHRDGQPVLSGEMVFKLYDTYGFPVDLTADLAREQKLRVDHAGFEKAMEAQRARSRQTSRFTEQHRIGAHLTAATEFLGYEDISTMGSLANVVAIYPHHPAIETSLKMGDEASIVLDQTPFYAESGGQVGDQGWITKENMVFQVNDTQKKGHVFIHIGQLTKGELTVGDRVSAEVNQARRAEIVLNHTATHLLHHVLRELLGEQVTQKGSLVEPARLRFDFSYPMPLTAKEIDHIEKRVNQDIRANYPGKVEIMSPEEAVQQGAMALFEEKYGNQVRVVTFGESMELCGGTHVHHTGDIGLFKIINECGVASGIRRIEAVTGASALAWLDQHEDLFKQKIAKLEEEKKIVEKQLMQLKTKLAVSESQEFALQTKELLGVKILVSKMSNSDPQHARNLIDQLKNTLGSAVIVFASEKAGKIHLIVGVTRDNIDSIRAGELVNMLAQQVGGKGGGRADLAEAGGNQPEHLDSALESVYPWIEKKLVNIQRAQG